MEQSLRMNADRFTGFADIYDHARPACPEKVKEILISYLGRTPACVVDMGCGTGLSTITWSEVSQKIIGIEPSADMLAVAEEKAAALDNVDFISTFSNETGLANDSVDIITCSQSFHWMDPESTLKEAGRILKSGGVFAAYDCDWPPICSWEAELAYNELFEKVSKIESAHTEIKNSFVKWDKENHLVNIKNSRQFRYVREIVFSNTEICNAERFISIAFSQGSVQAIMKAKINEINPYINAFQDRIREIFGNRDFQIDFCYRMRFGIK